MKLIKIIVLLTILFHIQQLKSQTSALDSIKQNIKDISNDSLWAEESLKFVKRLYDINIDTAYVYIKKIERKSKLTRNKRTEAIAYSQLAWYNYIQSNSDSSIYYWQKAAALFLEQKNDYDAGLLKSNIGMQYAHSGSYDLAKVNLNEAIQIAIFLDSLDLLASAYTNYGLIYDYQGEMDSGYYFYNKAREIGYKLEDYSRVSSATNNIGVMYYYFEDYANAIKYFREVLAYYYEIDSKERQIGVLLNMGVSFDKLNILDSSIYYYNKGIEVSNDLKNTLFLGKNYHNLGVIFYKKNDTDKALFYLNKALKYKLEANQERELISTYQYLSKLEIIKTNYRKASKFLLKCNSLAVKNNSLEDLKETRFIEHQYHLSKGESNLALAKYKAYISLKDSIYNINKLNKINELEEKYQSEKKEIENLRLEAENEAISIKVETQKKFLFGISLILVLMGIISYLIYYSYQKSKKINNILLNKNQKIQILNREIIHRTKNQLVLASSILAYQKNLLKNKNVKNLLIENEARINAISSVNKFLDVEITETSNFKHAITEIVKNNIFALSKGRNINFNIDALDVNIKPEQATIISIILNELSINSIKHAFIEKNVVPEIRITTTQEPMYFEVFYSDNGTINEDILIGQGMELISGLLDQLNGNYRILDSNAFSISIKIPRHE